MMSSFRSLSMFFLASTLVIQLAIAQTTVPTTAPIEKNAAGYLTATVPRPWSFPRDHGRHDGFKTEWWYFTGNVADDAGRKFGYQLTFFRASVSPINIPRGSPLSIGDFYFAHVAVSDLSTGEFHFKDRIEREQPGIAQSAAETMDVQLRDWSARFSATSSMALEASDPTFGIHFICNQPAGDLTGQPVLEGVDGINLKGRAKGQASYYYSIPRLPTTGAITLGEKTFHITGLSWMDHEFSSNAIGQNQIGWDWVGLQLNDGRSLMVYRLRNKEGGADYLSGTLIDATGNPTYLSDQDITFTGASPWKSTSGGAYPQTWSLQVKNLPPLTVQSRMPGQELRTDATTKIDYFEGSCSVNTAAGKPFGEGYLEMTGYAKPIEPF